MRVVSGLKKRKVITLSLCFLMVIVFGIYLIKQKMLADIDSVSLSQRQTKIAAGDFHTLALKSDGTVWAWGNNRNGQLGDGSNTDRIHPTRVSNISGIKAISAGSYHSLALKSDGTVWAWGMGMSGQLGNGTQNKSKNTPVQVINLNNVVAISAGSYHSLALKADGTVWAWGDNTYGELGNGTKINRPAPVQSSTNSQILSIDAGGYRSFALSQAGNVIGWGYNPAGQNTGAPSTITTPTSIQGLTGIGITAISAGLDHALALTSNGRILAWGKNTYGQLGNGTTDNPDGPVEVGEEYAGFQAFVAANGYSLALKSDGMVWAWGLNSYGRLGDGTNVNKKVPTQVIGLFSVIAIVGGNHSVALQSGGGLWVWGDNRFGQLGDGTKVSKSSPVKLSSFAGNEIDVAIGSRHSLMVKDAKVWAWGDNIYGELGLGTAESHNLPTEITALNDDVTGYSEVTRVAAGNYHSLALKANGTVWAWGKNAQGQLGDGSFEDKNIPTAIPNLSQTKAIFAGGDHSFALKADGTFWQWGNRQPTPEKVKEPRMLSVISFAVGADHFLANDSLGASWAWGDNSHGQWGDGSTITDTAPYEMMGSGIISLGAGRYSSMALYQNGQVATWGDGVTEPQLKEDLANISNIATGASHFITLKADGTVWAWGRNTEGQLGNGSNDDQSAASQVLNLSNVISIWGSATGDHTIVLKSDGTLWAWGRNTEGQLGDGSMTNRNQPVEVGVVVTQPITPMVSAGIAFSLALKDDGTVWAWGRNNRGQAGRDCGSQCLSPTQVAGLDNVKYIAAGFDFSVAVKKDGTVWTWGAYDYGQLGFNSSEDVKIPRQIPDFSDIVAVSSHSAHHSLALKSDGTVWAWGNNSDGQLGRGSSGGFSETPQMISSFDNFQAVEAGYTHSVALKNDGTVWTWGANFAGQLGDGSHVSRFTPVMVPNFTNVQAVSAGLVLTLALKNDSSVWAWGSNFWWGLGSGTDHGDETSPVPVLEQSIGDPHTGVIQIEATGLVGNSLKTGGELWGWGNSTMTCITSELAIPLPSDTTFKAISGTSTLLGIAPDDEVWQWPVDQNCYPVRIGLNLSS